MQAGSLAISVHDEIAAHKMYQPFEVLEKIQTHYDRERNKNQKMTEGNCVYNLSIIGWLLYSQSMLATD